jgi:GNAT superfamily N-acetyltransferase
MEMKKNCLRCPAPLAEDANAFICSYECTFCITCFMSLGGVCPNCGGELLARPKRGRIPSGTQIVPFTNNMTADLVRLFDEYRQFYQQPSDPGKVQIFLEMRLKNKESVIFMALRAGKPVGFVQLYPSFTSVGTARIWILNDLYVDETNRRSGVARELTEYVISFARETGASKVLLETSADNAKAQALYENLGFLRETSMFHYTFECRK